MTINLCETLEDRGRELLRDEFFAAIKRRILCDRSGLRVACEGGGCACAELADELSYLAFDEIK